MDCDAAMRTDTDVELSHRLATETGALLMSVRDAQASSDVASLGAAADLAAQQFLATELAGERPADAVLSEEAVDDPGRLTTERVWIIDPLDGTREFAEGREDWAVHVALWSAGELVTGAVALPGLGMVLSTGQPHRLVAATGVLRIAVSRTRPPSFSPSASLINSGENSCRWAQLASRWRQSCSARLRHISMHTGSMNGTPLHPLPLPEPPGCMQAVWTDLT